MSTFEETWTKEFVESLLEEFTKQGEINYLCIASNRFKVLWSHYSDDLSQLAERFIQNTDNQLGSVFNYDILFSCEEIRSRRRIRIEFLKYEIERLSK